MGSTSTLTAEVQPNVTLGLPVPPHTPHAISVSLPTWRDNVGYEEGEKRVADAMVSGYPRFFIHLSIQKLARIFAQKYGVDGEQCMLYPTQKIAMQCQAFLQARSIRARLVHLLICPEDKNNNRLVDLNTRSRVNHASTSSRNLHIVLFPGDVWPVAKEFWQHSGMGISSRLAEHCLSMLPEELTQVQIQIQSQSPSPPSNHHPFKVHNRHYSAKGHLQLSDSTSKVAHDDELSVDHSTYLEERYGRNLPQSFAPAAKRALRRRIAGVLIHDDQSDDHVQPSAGDKNLVVGPSSRGVADVSENDVFLFSTGMAAIWNAHNLALAVRPPAKSVCFGFTYTDTLKILQKWGRGCHFLASGLDADIDELETILEKEASRDPSTPPILALFTEFPSNPLLRSANVPRLRALADKYDFLIVIDDTIGNCVNVEVLPYADIVASSLSKIFSGVANVMGGSMVLNPRGRHYQELKTYMDSNFEDAYYDEDAIYMERNSRDFQARIRIIDINTEAVCDFLRSRSVTGGAKSAVIKEVFYPKYVTREHYEDCRTKHKFGDEDGKASGGGFGGLFSVTFTSDVASHAFFDALSCYKGPSLGTNFTLACPYTILAHFTELDWAAQCGVETGLVRVSVGIEDMEVLLEWFETASKAAEAAVAV